MFPKGETCSNTYLFEAGNIVKKKQMLTTRVIKNFINITLNCKKKFTFPVSVAFTPATLPLRQTASSVTET